MTGILPKLLVRQNTKYLLAVNNVGQLELLSSRGGSVKKDILSTNKIKEFDGTVYEDSILVIAVTSTNSLLYIKSDINGEKHISKITDSPQNSGGISNPIITCSNDGRLDLYFITRKDNVYPYLMNLSASAANQDWRVNQIASLKTEECSLLHICNDTKTAYIAALVDGKRHIYSTVRSAQGKWTPLVSVAVYNNRIESAVFVKTDRFHAIVKCTDGLYIDQLLLSSEAENPAVYLVDDRIHVFYEAGDNIDLMRQLAGSNQWERILSVKKSGYKLYRTESECYYTLGFDFPEIDDAYTLAKRLVKNVRATIHNHQSVENDGRIKKLEEDIYMHERMLFNLNAQMKQCLHSLEDIRIKLAKINSLQQ